MNEWCALTHYGRGFQKEEGGKYGGLFVPLGEKMSLTSGRFDYSRNQLYLPDVLAYFKQAEKDEWSRVGRTKVKAVRIFPSDM